MAAIETEKGPLPCPDSVAVIGGGRWARVLVDVLCGLLPPSVSLSVHSRGNADSMAAWAAARGLKKRIQLSSDWPQSHPSDTGAVIVANAARDHEAAVESALGAGIPVMVEKPIALTAAAAQRLADLASTRKIGFAAAQVFLFARYLDNYANLVASAGRIKSLHLHWADPRGEERYGERKQFDPSLPLLADSLPHVVPIAAALLSGLPDQCRQLKVQRGGAALDVELMAGDIPCTVRMERNAQRRQRIVQASVGDELFQLDFSTEPGTISRGAATSIGDLHWDSRPHPAARMLTAFLTWAAGGERDDRLDPAAGLLSCRLIDLTLEMYRAELLPWLIAKLEARPAVDEDLRYSLAELLQSDGPLPTGEVDRLIEAVTSRFASNGGARWAVELSRARDPAGLIRALAG